MSATPTRPRFLSTAGAWLIVLALALSFVLPIDGFGPTVCVVKNLTGLDCPGCGLTRSVTSVSHLEFGRAWDYNPFGVLLYPLMLMAAVGVLLPRRVREGLGELPASIQARLPPALWLLVLAMSLFGVVRFAGQLVTL